MEASPPPILTITMDSNHGDGGLTSKAIPEPSLNPLASPFSPTNSWSRHLFKLPHIPDSLKLSYLPPSRKGDRELAICSKEEVDRTLESWKEALQGFFADKRPFLPSVVAALERKWEIKESLEVFPRPDGSLIFLFSSLDERKRVLDSGPWFVMGTYLHIRPWNRKICSRKDFFSSLPVWIHLLNLPLHLWSLGSIGKIVSVIGCPLYLDENSTMSTKISYARICVEISADKPLPTSILVEVEGNADEIFVQPVEYESRFKTCTNCKVFGHSTEDCSKATLLSSTVRMLKKPPTTDNANSTGCRNQATKMVVGQASKVGWTKVKSKYKFMKKISAQNIPKASTTSEEPAKKKTLLVIPPVDKVSGVENS